MWWMDGVDERRQEGGERSRGAGKSRWTEHPDSWPPFAVLAWGPRVTVSRKKAEALENPNE